MDAALRVDARQVSRARVEHVGQPLRHEHRAQVARVLQTEPGQLHVHHSLLRRDTGRASRYGDRGGEGEGEAEREEQGEGKGDLEEVKGGVKEKYGIHDAK